MDEEKQETRYRYGMGGNDVVHVTQAEVTQFGMGGRPWYHDEWMQMPHTMLGCPPGLLYLTQLDQILVHQQVQLAEVCNNSNCIPNKYQIKNVHGQQVYVAGEESTLCMRMCCSDKRSFVMHIIDNAHQEVIRIVRPFEFWAGNCWCADCNDYNAFTISVESPPGQVIGRVRQRSSKWKEHYEILDANSQPILKVRGPCCSCQAIFCTDDVDFRIVTYDDSQQIGKIAKQWAGFAQECCTKVDHFALQFPLDLDAKVKATLLGALFLIEYVVFEKQKGG